MRWRRERSPGGMGTSPDWGDLVIGIESGKNFTVHLSDLPSMVSEGLLRSVQ